MINAHMWQVLAAHGRQEFQCTSELDQRMRDLEAALALTPEAAVSRDRNVSFYGHQHRDCLQQRMESSGDRCLRSDPRAGYPRAAGRDHGRFPSRRDARGHCAAFPSVALSDVYLIIAHYLTHTAEIDAYLSRRQAEAAKPQCMIETRFNPVGIRARLLARQRGAR